MATLTSKLIIELLDRATGPAHAVAGAINRLTAMQTRNAAALAATQTQMIGALAAAYGLKRALAAPVSAASDFETTMLDIGQKADMSDAAIAALGARIRKLGPIVNQSSAEVAKGVDALIGFGLDPERAMALMEPIGQAATAYRAEIDDLAKASYAALDNLKLPAEQFGKALDAMAVAGKEGAFELKDMAREFPSLTSGAQALGMTGVTAVARLAAVLEIARKGAASGNEAATNTANLMQKIIAPEAVTKFKKVGIDIRAELKKTQKAGGDVFEMVDRLLKKATKGDQAKIVDFFADKQVLEFLRPLWQNIDEYKRIRDQALKATGVVEADFKRRMLTNAAVTNAFNVRLRELAITIGNTLLPSVNTALDAIRPMLHTIEKFVAANPKLAAGLIGASAGLIALRIAALALKYAALWMWGGALAAARVALLALGLAAATIGVPLTILGGLLVAVAGYAYTHWDEVLKLWQRLKSPWGELRGEIAKTREEAGKPWKKLPEKMGQTGAKMAGPWDDIGAKMSATWDMIIEKWNGLGAKLAETWRAISEPMVAAVTELAGKIKAGASALYDAGMTLVAQLWEGMKAKAAALLGWASGLAGRIAGAFSAARSSAGGGQAPAVAGARATGGPVQARRPYIVGERGRELFRPDQSGTIIDAAETERWLAALETIPARLRGVMARANSLLAAPSAARRQGADTPYVLPAGGQLTDLGFARDLVAQIGGAIRPAAGGSGGRAAGGGVVNHNSFSVSVQAAAGQSAEQVAEVVLRKLSDKLDALSRGAYSDGAYA